MIVFTWNLIGKMGEEYRHIKFFLKNSEVSSIKTILNVEDRALMVFDLFHNSRVFKGLTLVEPTVAKITIPLRNKAD
jgi:hypothetical protein